MIEHEIPNKAMVEVYTRRLVDACNLLRVIDTKDYPLKEYSSGEHKQVRAKNGGWVETDEFVSLPIYPKDRIKGLRFGVSHTIFDTRTMLSRWGALDEADKVIRELSARRDAGSYIGNRKDESCEGK